MNLSNIHSCFLNTQNSIHSLILRCGASCVHRSQVHPEIFNPEDLEFVNLGSQRVIRVLHLSPNQSTQPVSTANQNGFNSQNEQIRKIFDVSSEEYWFTRSNRPFKIGDACDCLSNTLTSHGKLPKSWKDVTDGFSEMIKKSFAESHSNDLGKGSVTEVIERFADNFVKLVLDDALYKFLNIQRNPSKNLESKDSFLNDKPVWDYANVNNHSVNSNTDKNIASHKDAIVEVHHSENEFLENTYITKRDYGDSKNEIERLLRTSSDGIVNLSFAGTLSEPDELSSSINREDHSVSTDILQSKLDSLSAVNADLKKSEFTRGSAFLESRTKENVKDASMASEVILTSTELHERKFRMFVKDVGNGSFSNEDSLHISNVTKDQQGDASVGSNPDIHDPTENNVTMERKVDVDRCWHSKAPQKPSLLFLHGAGSSADIWSVQLEYFASAGYEVLAPDMLGHGYSSAPDNRSAYAFDRLLEDVLHIFDRFIPDHRKCVVIGHSYGSCFAAAVARYRPQQVVQLVLLSSGGPSPLVPKQAFFSFPSCVMSFMKPFLMCGFKRDLFYAPRGKHLPPCCTYELPPYVLKHVESGQEWSEGDSAFHRRILVPTLLVHGLKDPYITLVEECEMERTIPRSFLEVISNAGHMLMLDTPEQLCHMVHSFITWWNS